MSRLRCDCGDTECPSCGTAQGTFRPARRRAPRPVIAAPPDDVLADLQFLRRILLDAQRTEQARIVEAAFAEIRALRRRLDPQNREPPHCASCDCGTL